MKRLYILIFILFIFSLILGLIAIDYYVDLDAESISTLLQNLNQKEIAVNDK